MTGKKEKILMVRMTDREYQALKAYAEAENCSMAAVVKRLLKQLQSDALLH